MGFAQQIEKSKVFQSLNGNPVLRLYSTLNSYGFYFHIRISSLFFVREFLLNIYYFDQSNVY